MNNTINSCVEISLQDGESLTSIKTSQDIQENFFPITVLKVYLDGNLNNSLYNFSFNTYNPMHSSYLNFLPEDAIEGTYYGSDTYLMTSPNGANSYKQFFL